jgi:HAD superfamily hydrolase (TIGR01549 family)
MTKKVRPRIRPQLITFDFGDTLVTSTPSYLERIALGLTEIGFPCRAQDVEAAFHRSDLKHSAQMLAQAPFDNATFQTGFAETLFEELKLSGDEAELYEKLARWLLDFRPKRMLMPGAGELLDALKRRGYRLGVISNNDGNTRPKCAAVDIEKYFEFILDSTLEGVMKPDGRIFAKALQLGGASAEKTVHVGDLWGCDILGAHAAGLWAAWLSNPYVSPDPVDRVFTIEKLLDLLEILPS